MSTFNVRETQGSVQTVAEFDELLKRYEKQSPADYAKKVANGEFDRFRKTLVDYVEEAPKAKSKKSTGEDNS